MRPYLHLLQHILHEDLENCDRTDTAAYSCGRSPDRAFEHGGYGALPRNPLLKGSASLFVTQERQSLQDSAFPGRSLGTRSLNRCHIVGQVTNLSYDSNSSSEHWQIPC
jgi:hypothetical protein